MSTVAPDGIYTPEDLLTRPDGDRYELVDGRLVELNMSKLSSHVAGQIYGLLYDYCRKHYDGWLFPEGTSYQCFSDAPQKVRKPDVSFIDLKRLPIDCDDEGHISIAPDLAVEVISPNDLVYEVDEKVEELLSAGVRLVWEVNPEKRVVFVHRKDGSTNKLHENDEITGEDVIPGFHCQVKEFFRKPGESA
jgi:Uma2 family endonuclease